MNPKDYGMLGLELRSRVIETLSIKCKFIAKPLS
jgi:hypothetical protein